MQGLPLHPAIVHVPIGVALVVPLVAIVVLEAARRAGRLDRARWAIVVLLQAIVFGGALAALRTGETDEDRVEQVVARSAIHEHEERGEVFTWLAGGAFVAGIAGLVIPARRAQLAAAVVASTVAVVVGAATYWVGHSGGELVYRQGAARAHAPGGPAGPGRPIAPGD